MKILFLTVAMVVWPCLSWAQLEDAVMQRELVGVKEVKVFVLSDEDNLKCGVPRENVIKASIENELAKAGIARSESNKQQMVIWVSTADAGSNCALSAIYEFRKVVEFSSGTRTENGPINVWVVKALVALNKRNGNLGTTFYTDMLGSFLTRWRNANVGADFVRPIGVTQQPSGPNIRTVQQRLVNLGHLQGPIDGIAGPGTREAIQAFQRANRMPATGDLDQETMLKLFP